MDEKAAEQTKPTDLTRVAPLGVLETTQKELADTRKQLAKLGIELEQTQALARTDPLTGLNNRRAMMEQLQREIARAQRTAEPFSIAILDIDNFKAVNDTYGHEAGDQALFHLAGLIKAGIRQADEAYRYGGDEFITTLPGSPAPHARFVIDRIRMQVERMPLVVDGRNVTLSLSAGVAQLLANEKIDSLLRRADQALYNAKSAGRNQVVIASNAAHRGRVPPVVD